MRKQLDMRTEAANLRRFGRNFAGRKGISFPEPVDGLVSRRVLVEALLPGETLSELVATPPGGTVLHTGEGKAGGAEAEPPHPAIEPATRKALARRGLQAFLQMVRPCPRLASARASRAPAPHLHCPAALLVSHANGCALNAVASAPSVTPAASS
jgi:aarF domain-containing kinase